MIHDRASHSAWRPLLEGAAAETAWKIVDDIAACLADPDHLSTLDRVQRGGSLAGGDAGVSLFYTYLAMARDGQDDASKWFEIAEAYLDRAIEALQSQPMLPGLYGGFTGVAWTAEHLEGRLYESADDEGAADGDDGEDVNEIDATLAQLLEKPGWKSDYDLIVGLAGLGVYALEAWPRPSAATCLEHLVDRFEELAREHGAGRTWFTAPELLPEHQREVCPDGYYNLGVAHGVPAVLVVLAQIAAAGIATEKARRLVADGVTWLLDQRLDPEVVGSCFSSWVMDGREPAGSRLAWCYGDPGVAAALVTAGRTLGRDDWQRAGCEIARVAAARPLEKALVQDAGLCHGAAGLAHLFNRLHQSTGEAGFAETARFWFDQTFGMRRPGEGLAGYQALLPSGGSGLDWGPDPGFLTGVAGIGLALLGGLTAIEPGWDRVLAIGEPASSS